MNASRLNDAQTRRQRRLRPRVLALSIALALGLPGAQGQTWIGGATGNWSDPTRWLGGVPGAQANVDMGGGGTVRVDVDARLNLLSLGSYFSPTFLTIAAGRTLTLGDGPETPLAYYGSFQALGTLTIGDGPGAGAATLRLTEQYTVPTLTASDIRLNGAGNLIDGQFSGLLIWGGQVAGAGEIREVHMLGEGWVKAEGELLLNTVNFGRGYFDTGPWGVGLEVTAASRATVQGGDLLLNGTLSGYVYVRNGGTLVLDGPVDTLWGHLNLGSDARVLQAGGGSALQSMRVDGTLQLDAGVQQTVGLRQLVGNLLVQGAQTSLTSTINSFADGVQRGNITLQGGSFAYNGAPVHTNTGRIELRDNARFLAAGGVPALWGLQVNEGTLILSNTREQINNFDQRGTLLLRSGARLDVAGVLANVEAGGLLSGSFDLDASTLTYAYARQDTIPLDGSDPGSSGVFSTVSVNSGVLKLRNGAQLLTQGQDALRSLRTNSAGALLQLGGSQPLQLDASLTNFGSIALSEDAVLQVAGDLENFQSLALRDGSQLLLAGRLYNQKNVVIQSARDVSLAGVSNRGNFSLSARQAALGSFENLASATLRGAGSTGHMSLLVNRGDLTLAEGSWTADQARLVPQAAGESGRLTIARTASLQMAADGLMDNGALGRAGQVITIDGTLATPAFADRAFDLRADLTVRGSFTQGGANWLDLLAQNFGSLRVYGQQVKADFGTINLGLLDLREGSHWRTGALRNHPEGTLLIDPTSRLTLTTTSGGAGLHGNTRILGTLDLGGAGMSFNGGTHEVRGRMLANGEGSGNGLDVVRYNAGTLQLYGQQVQARNVSTFQPWVNTGRLELREGTSFAAAAFQSTGTVVIDASSQATLGAAAFSANGVVENDGLLRLSPDGVDGHGHWWQRYTGGAQASLIVDPGTLLQISTGLTQAGTLSGRQYSLLGKVTVPEAILAVAAGTTLVGGPDLRLASDGRMALLDLQTVNGDAELRGMNQIERQRQLLVINGRLGFVGSSLAYAPRVFMPGYGYAPRQVVNDGVLDVRGNSRIVFSGLYNNGRVSVEAGSTLDAFDGYAPGVGLPGPNLTVGQWQVGGTLKLAGGRQSVLPAAVSYEYIGAAARIYTEEFDGGLTRRDEYGLFDDVLARVDGSLTLSGHSLNAAAGQGFVNTGTVLLRQQATLSTRGLRQQGQLQVLADSVLDTRLGAADAGRDVVQDTASARTRLDGTLHTSSFQLLAGQLQGSGVLDGNLVIGSAGQLQLQVRSWSDHDHFSVLGGLRAGGVLQIDLEGGLTNGPIGGLTGGATALQLLSWATLKGSFAQIQLSASGWRTELRRDGLYLVSSVPEPATWLVLLLGLGALGLRRARAQQA